MAQSKSDKETSSDDKVKKLRTTADPNKLSVELDGVFYFDPYKHFQNENDEIPVDLDEDNSKIKYNPARYKEYLDKYFLEMKEEKSSWVIDAMRHDPALMLDPINDYYKKLIPRDLLLNLDEKDVMDIITLYDPVTWGLKLVHSVVEQAAV